MSKIVTLEGYDYISKLLSDLKKEKIHWVEEKRIAAEQGDRTENSEYQGAKENIRNLDKQLYKLKWIIENTKAVDISKRTATDIILFGSTVKVLKTDPSGEEELCLKIVGTEELIYIQKISDCFCMSTLSPVGSLLMKKEVGDEIDYNETTYEVLEIS